MLQLTISFFVLFFVRASNVFPCSDSVPSNFWQNLQKQISGPIVLPSSKGWDTASSQWNIIYPREPLGVVFAESVQDIVTTLSLARQAQVCVVPRSSGHSYSGQAVLSGRLVLDVSYLNATKFDNTTLRLTVGPGTSLWMLVDVCEQHNVMVTWGGCGDVRMGGYLQGGGEGNGERITGVGIDRVLRYNIVLTNGTVLNNVSQDFHPDLFWALRGGGGPGGNFGVVTEIELQTRSIFPDITQALYFSIVINQTDAADLCVKFFGPSPNSFAAGVLFLQSGDVIVNGWWLGDVTQGRDFLQNLVEGFGIVSSSIEITTLYDASRRDFVKGATPPSVYFAGAHSVQATRQPSKAEWQSIIDFVKRAPPLDPQDGQFFVAAFLTGGAVNVPARNATAFPHRNSIFDIEWASSLDNNSSLPEFTKWGDDFYEVVKPIFTVDGKYGVYSNLADFTLQNSADHYYMENYARLQKMKTMYDPENYFSFPQSIEPA